MNEWLIDGSFVLHRLDSLTCSINHDGVEGLDSADSRDGSYEKPGENGGVITSGLDGMRPVTLSGRVNSSTPLQHDQDRRALITAVGRQRDAYSFPILRRHQFTTLGGTTYFFYAQTTKLKMPKKENTFSDFQLQLLVPSSSILQNGVASSGSIPLAVSSGVTFPITFPLTFGGLSGGSVTLTNTGDRTSWPVIRLAGQLTNPFIINTTTGKLMQLDYVLTGGDYIDIFMGDGVDPSGNWVVGKRVTRNGTDYIIDALDDDAGSDWWGIEPGVNVIGFSSGSASDNGTMTISFYHALEGI